MGLRWKYLLRAVLYASSIGWTLVTLILLQVNNISAVYWAFALFGFLIIFLELFFTVEYANSPFNGATHISKKRFLRQGMNHITYVIFTYVGLVFYIYYQHSILVTSFLVFLVYLGLIANFFLLPFYVVNRKENSVTRVFTHDKIQALMFVYKIFSYYIVNLGFFQMYSLYVIGDGLLFIWNFFLNFLYLYFFLNRRNIVTSLNLSYTFIFAIITSVLIFASNTDFYNLNASIATIYFYLASMFFYHKIDGSLSKELLIEYTSIAVILTIFIFSV